MENNEIEAKLESIDANRAKLAKLKEEVKFLEKTLDFEENTIITYLRETSAFVSDKFRAFVEVKAGPCRPAWKDCFIKLAERCGLNPVEEEERVKKETKVKETEVLVITKS
jgi:hypothetical protein